MTRLSGFAYLFLIPISISLFYRFYLYDHPLASIPTYRLELRRNAPSALPPKIDYPPGSFVRRIVAVGDLHGDMRNARKVLRMSNVVDEFDDWSGDVDIFVQVGDVLDGGNDTIKLIQWLDELRGQAHQAGGQMISHMGNHELMNVVGDWSFVKDQEILSFGDKTIRQEAVTSGWLANTWSANYSFATRLPLHPSLGAPNTDYLPYHAKSPFPASLSHSAISFVHGGLAPTYQDLTPFPSRINEVGKSLFRRLQARDPQPEPARPGDPEPVLPPDFAPEEIKFYGDDGPLFYRGWAKESNDTACPLVDGVLMRTGTRRMVMGHTPNYKEMVSRCDGKILLIDTGISRAYGGVLSALSINYALQPSTSNTRWKERETIVALYEDRHEVLVDEERDINAAF